MNNKEYTDLVTQSKYPEESIVPLDDAFIDNRGYIQNLLNTNINGAAIITSCKGSIRSNHYHKEDYHYLYVLSGSMRYKEFFVRNCSHNCSDCDCDKICNPNCYMCGPWEKDFIVRSGQMVFTPPMMIHQTVFLEDTVLISFSKRNRDHNNHEEDVMRVNI